MTAGSRTPAPVVFDGRYIQDRYHGIGRYAFHLLAELAGLLPAQPFVVLRDPALPDHRFDWPALAALPQVRVRPVRARPFSARELWAVPRAIAAAHSRLYHTPYFALPWWLPTPGIITVHDCIFEHDPRYMPRPAGRLYYRLLMRASLRRARSICVPSDATAADLTRFYGVRAERMVITPEAAAPEFHPIADEAVLDGVRARYDLPAQFVLAVGARRPHKNFATLVEAVVRLDGVPLIFAGTADERFPDTAAAAAEALGAPVRFLGSVPEVDLPPLYNLATIFACPSYIEGFGLPVLEAMACGRPVVCSDIPVFTEVAGDAARFVPPDAPAAWAAALAALWSDPAARATLGAAGQARAATFAWRRAAEAVLPLYRTARAPAPG